LRGGIKIVLIPEENAKDLVEISESIKKGLEIVPVSRMDEVLARAMTRKPEPIEWDDASRGQIAEDRIGGRALTFLGQQSLS
jgi:ATP-dependent Lon protease